MVATDALEIGQQRPRQSTKTNFVGDGGAEVAEFLLWPRPAHPAETRAPSRDPRTPAEAWSRAGSPELAQTLAANEREHPVTHLQWPRRAGEAVRPNTEVRAWLGDELQLETSLPKPTAKQRHQVG